MNEVIEKDVETKTDYNNFEMIFSFKRPSHDVHIGYNEKNSMLAD